MTALLYLLQTLAVLWHTLAFAAGGVFVYLSYRALFGMDVYESRWGKVIRHADMHLWLSGFAIIALGALGVGIEKYFSNPKLWTKVTVIIVWLFSTQYLKYIALPQFKEGKRRAMLASASVNLACWLYGAFLGVAKPLAHGNAPYAALAGGFMVTILLCFAATFRYERRRTV